MTDDQLDEDDLKLKQLRAVWVSMRDEQPSDRGLDALLAAAREKADVMRTAEALPSWWQRFTSVMRKPPALAMASAVLVIGGAVVVLQQNDVSKLAAPRPMQVPMQSAPETMTETMTPPPPSPAGSPADEAPPPARVQSAASTDDLRRDERPGAKPAKSRRSGASSGALASPAPSKPAETSDHAEPPPKRPASKPGYGAGAGRASPTSSELEGRQAPAESEAPYASRAPSTGIATQQPVNANRAVDATLDDLIKQCERAAARGDCAAARELAARIEKRDATAYKARVRTNQTIGRCLER
ncbi:MAG: hypothetical protein AB7O24_23000 [Kofleriaceae bacterium]